MAITSFQQLAPQNTLTGGFSAPFSPALYGGQALDRLGMGSVATNPTAQMLQMSMQQTQLLLDMTQMLLTLMAPGQNTSNAGSSSATPSGQTSSATPVGDTKATSEADAGSGGPKVQKFIDAALGKQGTRYVFGAAGPDTFDCSGLVSWALKQAGSKVGRMSAEGYRSHYKGAEVSKDQLKPGDLVFFSDTGHAPASHIEIYIGNGQTMGAHTESMPNGKAKLNTKRLIMAARPPELQG
ncbi:MAG: C40 family peptidase [Candidatus Eremiobacteraeota bacterium]|nr:C40 family peptidase [Candidatus Eremiobacteraeota bacterium]